MTTTTQEILLDHRLNEAKTMKALVFRGPNQIDIEEVPIPRPGPGEVVIRVSSPRSAAPISIFSRANIP